MNISQEQKQSSQVNPAVAELRAIRAEITQVRDEVAGFRTEVKRRSYVDQIAGGVILAGVIGWVAFFVLALIGQILFAAR